MGFGPVGVAAAFEQTPVADEPPTPSPESKPPRPIDAIRDNSFLIEEAYNQEPGVVQHIWTAQFGKNDRGDANDRTWDLSFTQEWPVFSQRHQLSYTIPYSFVDGVGEHQSGLGDVLLNYRYQLFDDVPGSVAFSPRVSLVFPSGDEDRDMGNGVLGYQVNLPFSKTLSDRMYVNLNLGCSYYPNVEWESSNGRDSDRYDLVDVNVGGSLIVAVNESVHLMLEAAWNHDRSLDERPAFGGRMRADRLRIDEVVLSPGVRWAMNFPGDVQVVPGLAFPIGLTSESPEYGVFFYLSVEHPFGSRGEME
jgi:hypothetical protein